MIDPQLLKTNIEAIEENIRKRDLNIDLDKLNQSNIELDLLSYSAVKLVSRFSD